MSTDITATYPHEYENVPGKSLEIGANPHETVLQQRCRWCTKKQAAIKTSECMPRKLQEVGRLVLSEYNPEGMERFAGRKCVTCGDEIMGHWLRAGSQDYYCGEGSPQTSDGVTKCVWDVPEGFGK